MPANNDLIAMPTDRFLEIREHAAGTAKTSAELAIAYGLLEIASAVRYLGESIKDAAPDLTALDLLKESGDALNFVGRAIDRLGHGNAATDMGAIENLAGKIVEAAGVIAGAIQENGEAFQDRSEHGS